MLLSDGVHVGGICGLDGIALDTLFGGYTPSVVDAGYKSETRGNMITWKKRRSYMRQTLFFTSTVILVLEVDATLIKLWSSW